MSPRAFAEEWVGVRYLKNGDSRKGIDAPNFVRRLYDTVYGFVPGTNTKDIYRNGTLIPLDESNPLPSLRVGDLLFLTSHADRPRHVMVYIGDGEMAHATDIRGVVIDPVPESQPTYLWLVATRPERPLGPGDDPSRP